MNALQKIQKWEVMKTGYRRPDHQDAEVLLHVDKESVNKYPPAFNALDEYAWRFRFGISFCCNSEDYERASAHAARELVHAVHGPIEDPIRKAMSAVYNREHTEALRLLSEVLSFIDGRNL